MKLSLKNPVALSPLYAGAIEKPLHPEFFEFSSQAVKIFVPQRRTNVLRRDQPKRTELMTGIVRPLEGLEKVLRYEPGTGRFFWLVNRPRKTKAGDEAGCKNKKGYIEIRYNHKTYNAHRIAWYLQTGRDPGAVNIDHINCIKSDNRFVNLRLATNEQNSRNKKKGQGFSSKYKGVSWYKRKGKWMSQIRYGGKSVHLGYFEDEYEAHLAYRKAAAAYHGEFANLG